MPNLARGDATSTSIGANGRMKMYVIDGTKKTITPCCTLAAYMYALESTHESCMACMYAWTTMKVGPQQTG